MSVGLLCSTDCSAYQPGEIIPFDPEPDLAGIGVIISFTVSLVFTILITWGASIVVDTYCHNAGDEIAKFSVSSISQRSKIVHDKINNTAKGRKLRQACFITLIFSDQQLIVGTSLLTAAYLKHCTLTQYHFEIAGLLSLSSFRTFQFAAGILAGTLKSNFSKGWRLFWVTAVASGILVTYIFRMNVYFLHPYGSSLYCLQKLIQSGEGYTPLEATRLAYTIFTEVIIVYSRCVFRLFPTMYTWRPIKMSIHSLQRIFLLPGKKHIEAKEKGNTWTAHLWRVTTFVSIMARYLISSTILELAAVTAIFVRVMFLVWAARQNASRNGRTGSEDGWGFGQLLPLFLLALPITTLVESIRSPWEISSAANQPNLPENQSENEDPSVRKLFLRRQALTNITNFNVIDSKSKHTMAPSQRLRALSSPDLTARTNSEPLGIDSSSTMLEASPTLERQKIAKDSRSEHEWMRRVERYESTYLNRGLFRVWVFLFDMGLLIMHTIIILPMRWGPSSF